MSINQDNRFQINPISLDMKRSKFPRTNSHKLTMNAGVLVPFYIDEVLPGDTFDINVSAVMRSITPVAPVIDNGFLDIQFYYVPMRLCTLHEHDAEKVLVAENFNSSWAPATEATFINTGNVIDLGDLDSGSGVNPQSLADYLGVPLLSTDDTSNLSGNYILSTPFVAYGKIWNEWFRDENTQAPITDWSTWLKYVGAPFNISLFNDGETALCPVAKYHDYFTSSLIAPQKGDSVLLPLGEWAPVQTRTEVADNKVGNMNLTDSITGEAYTGSGQLGSTSGAMSHSSTAITTTGYVKPRNLWADLSGATASSINDIREAFAIQRMLEKDARGGTRFREAIYTHFGVMVAESAVQVPQYLFGRRIPLGVQQVVQTSSTNEVSPLGDTGAFGYTQYAERCFTKSFTEWGYVIGVACVRSFQSYSQGLPKMFTRFRRYDYYDPTFANLGELPVYKRELYLKDRTTSTFNQPFGYNEAWAEYRFKPNLISGYLAPDSGDTSLGAWTYTNNFSASPTLNSDFIVQPRSQFDNTFVVSDSNYQFIADFYVDNECMRVMPLFSIPGLIDHH